METGADQREESGIKETRGCECGAEYPDLPFTTNALDYH